MKPTTSPSCTRSEIVSDSPAYSVAEWVSDGDMRGIMSNKVKSPSVYAGFGLPVRIPPGGSWMHALFEDDPAAGPVSVSRAAWDLVPSARIGDLVVAGSTYRIVGGALEEVS